MIILTNIDLTPQRFMDDMDCGELRFICNTNKELMRAYTAATKERIHISLSDLSSASFDAVVCDTKVQSGSRDTERCYVHLRLMSPVLLQRHI